MMVDNIHRMRQRHIGASMLLMMLTVLVAGSSASPVSRCGDNQFFDRAAQICTNCDEICNPLRGTDYLCDQYADECRPPELAGTSAELLTSTTLSSVNQPSTGSSQVLVPVLLVITLLCSLVTVAVIFLAILLCKRQHMLCFRYGQQNRSTVVPATAVSTSKEALALNVVKPHFMTDASMRLLQNQATLAADNDDVGDAGVVTG